MRTLLTPKVKTLNNLIYGDFKPALDAVKGNLDTLRQRFNRVFPQTMDENLFKVATASKILNHKMASNFFPMVEIQSGSGRIDLALFLFEPTRSSVL